MLSLENKLLPNKRIRARGAVSNDAGRFEATTEVPFYDGWDIAEDEHLVRTSVRIETPRSAITYNTSPDLPFDRSINPYRGCEHGCIYCFARPSHAFLNLSPGLDFETQLVARPGIAAVLDHELRRRGYKVATIALGTNTDPYQPIEVKHRIMRDILAVLAAHDHPLAITTKGAMILRDLDLLAPMAAKGLLRVGISVTTLDPSLARSLEPRASTPSRRLAVISELAAAGIPVRVMVAPVIPGMTDAELETILQAAHKAGAVAASYIALRLPLEVSALFQDWLQQHAPDKAAKVMARIRDMHGGRDYDPQFGQRMRGQGIWADLLRQRFDREVAKLGLATRLAPLRTDLFSARREIKDQYSLDL